MTQKKDKYYMIVDKKTNKPILMGAQLPVFWLRKIAKMVMIQRGFEPTGKIVAVKIELCQI